jgi:hypothetical protein
LRGFGELGSENMTLFLAALLLPLHFTAPADTLGADGAGQVHVSPAPVGSYLFHRLDDRGTMVATPGYADSAGTALLLPHAPGTRETVWLSPGATGREVTIYVLSQDARGNVSAPSNGCVLRRVSLDVAIARPAHERSPQEEKEMVMRYYGVAPEPRPDAYPGYRLDLRGSRTTELPGFERRSRHEAGGTTLTPEALFFRRWTP